VRGYGEFNWLRRGLAVGFDEHMNELLCSVKSGDIWTS
jgi:hypothetical protein